MRTLNVISLNTPTGRYVYMALFWVCMACISLNALGQTKTYTPSPKSKKLEDSAIQIFTTSDGRPEILSQVEKLLNQVIKTDPKYYGGWANLLTFYGRTGQDVKAMPLAQKIVAHFPDIPDAYFNYGVLQYVSGHQREATETFARLLLLYEDLLQKNKSGAIYTGLLTQKAITLILIDKPTEGKKILMKIHDAEKDPYKKSYLAFYINSDKETIIRDKVPGK